MPPSTESHLLHDDASGEAWFQKGATLLEGRKQERETKEKLLKAMNRSIMQEWHFWLALCFGMFAFAAQLLASAGWGVTIPLTVSGFFSFVNAMDRVAAKRTQAILAWIEHAREKEQRPKAASE